MNAVEGEVSGRVQGVGFRYFTQSLAVGLDIVGYVYNTPKGTVRFFAQGPDGVLQQFLKSIATGPPGARVDGCDIRDGKVDNSITSFDIKY